MKTKFVKTSIVLVILLNLSFLAWADQRHLTPEQINRVRMFKPTVSEVDPKSIQQTINELERSAHPEVALIIKEAMAQAYTDIVKEQNVQGLHKKEWLYSMVALNMAYFQFGGDKDSAGGTKNLNKLIRYKLKQYLPSDIYNKPGFRCSLG